MARSDSWLHPHFTFLIPHSAFCIPHSSFCIHNSAFSIHNSAFHLHPFTHFLIAFHNDFVTDLQAFTDDDPRAGITRKRDFPPRGATVFGHPNELAFLINQNCVGGYDNAFGDIGFQHHLPNHPWRKFLVRLLNEHLDGITVCKY